MQKLCCNKTHALTFFLLPYSIDFSIWEGHGATVLCRQFCSGFSNISIYLYVFIYLYIYTVIANSRNLQIHQNSQVYMYATEFKVNRNLALCFPFEQCLFLNFWPIPITFNKNASAKLLLLKRSKSFFFSAFIFYTLTCV